MKQPLPKPRNPFVIHMRAKSAAPHGKSKKAVRRDAKISLKQNKEE